MQQHSSVVRRRFRLHPAQSIVVGFLGAVLLGTGLLMLPPMTTSPEGTTFVDALFTATSAVCVTGLTVVDTATHWTPLGQVTILVLIQLGGLGIMIFASLIGLALARKLSVRTRLNTVAEAKSVGYQDVRGPGPGYRRHLAYRRTGHLGFAVSEVHVRVRVLTGSGCLARALPLGVFVQQRRFRTVLEQHDGLRRRPVHLSADVRRHHPRRARFPRDPAAPARVHPAPALEHEHEARSLGHRRSGDRRHCVPHDRRVEQCRDLRAPRPRGSRARGVLRVGADAHGRLQQRRHRSHARRELVRDGRADVHRRRTCGHGRRHQGHDIRGAVLHPRHGVPRRGRREHLRQTPLPRGASAGHHRGAGRCRRGHGRNAPSDAPDRPVVSTSSHSRPSPRSPRSDCRRESLPTSRRPPKSSSWS